MFSKTLAAVICTVVFSSSVLAAELTAPIKTPDLGVGEGDTVEKMLAIDASIALRTEQQRLADRLAAASARLDTHSEPQLPIMTPPVETKAEDSAQQISLAIAQAGSTKPATSLPTLSGIYGLGSQLFADVEIQGVRYRFQRGKTHALSARKNLPWTLARITPPCVVLNSQEAPGVEQTLCIEQQSEAAQ